MSRPPSVRETGRQGVLRACLDLLEAEKVFHLRLNSGTAKQGKYLIKLCPEGTPDILFTYVGRPYGKVVVWVEAKSAVGPHREAQKEFQKAAELRDEIYLLVRSVDELRQWLIDYAVISKNRGMAHG